MASPKRPKKAFIKFAVAAFIAFFLGIAAIGTLMVVVSTASTEAEKQKKEAEEQVAQAKLEAEKAIKQKEAELATIPKMIEAVDDIPAETLIEPDMVKVVTLNPGESPAVGVITQLGDVVGKVSSIKILAGQALKKDMLFNQIELPPIPDGYRAVTIKVDNISGLNGLVVPGVFVDVLTTVKPAKTSITKTLLQRVRVVASDSVRNGAAASSSLGPSPSVPGGNQESIHSVTLAVTPEQAERLVLANKEGVFHLALRNFTDKAYASVKGADLDFIVSGVDKPNLNRTIPHPPVFPRIPYDFRGRSDGLPPPQLPNRAKNNFTMEIIKADSHETRTFETD
jgi:pilus assembly protein CpaB